MDEPVMTSKSPHVLKLEAGTYWYCACGRSENQPWCDGAHKGTAFRPVRVELEEARNVALCGCRRTGSEPFCDGTHKNL